MRIEVIPQIPILFCVACERELASNRLIFNQKRGIAALLCDSCLLDLEQLFTRKVGWMGDIGGVGCDPADMDAECTCGMGMGTIASEEHAENCPMALI